MDFCLNTNMMQRPSLNLYRNDKTYGTKQYLKQFYIQYLIDNTQE
jgi:hypothetical protein